MANSTGRELAIVTGASRGIGRAITLRLAREGMEVVLIGRSKLLLEEVAEAAGEHGGKAHVRVCDLADMDAVTATFDRFREEFGRLDLLVNNAGAFLECPTECVHPGDWERILRINLTAPFVACKAVLPMLYKQRGGKIVNIASVAGLAGYYHQSAYCAAKHGLVGFGRALAIEARPYNVHVHTICPGGVRTNFFEGTQLEERLSGQTILEPENVADAVWYLYRQPVNVDIPELVMRRTH